MVDYRDLEIRHLGSIYEGLLEYQVRVADQPLAVRKVKGKEVYEAIRTENEQAARAAGEGLAEVASTVRPAVKGRRTNAQANLLTDSTNAKADDHRRTA